MTMASPTGSNDKIDIDERLSALLTNAAAVRAIAGAVENTLGPHGLDTMLVDRTGDIVVTNAGVTILDRMEVTHPAARMVINIARNQHEQIGDGTTTATIIAGALVNEGLNYVIKGVPVSKILEGIKAGIDACLTEIEAKAIKVKSLDDPMLFNVARVAGRGQDDIAAGVMQLASSMKRSTLLDPVFKLADRIVAEVGAENEVYRGLLVKKRRLNDQMPRKLEDVRILMLEDSLMPEELSDSALKTEAGFSKYLERQEEFRDNCARLVAMGVRLIVAEGGIDDFAEELLTREGVMALGRVGGSEFKDILEFTGARPLKRTGLSRDESAIMPYLGHAARVSEDQKLGHVRISGGKGEAIATFLLGAATEEIAGEKERIARDAASSLQAAVRGGIVAGGGSLEVSLIPRLKKVRSTARGMAVYGIDCVIEALKRPMAQIMANAGFNPLEKLEEVTKRGEEKSGSWGFDCDTGAIVDMVKEGIVDPLLVKKHVLKAALEVAGAILRINTIIKMRDGEIRNSFA
jgi:archaeal chaperonin